MTAPLRLACIDSEAPPLFHRATADGARTGYEPAVGALLAAELGRPLEWVFRPWAEMIPAVRRGEADAVLCGQGVTAERAELVGFTRPYAIFHESVLVRADDAVAGPEGLRGRRVAAIAGSTNMALARTFPDIEPVAFDGDSADVFGDMLTALRSGEVDAVVDDDVVFVPLDDDPAYRLAFTVRTANPWALGVAKDRPDLRTDLDAALARITADGRLAKAWSAWMPSLPYPFGSEPS